MRKTIAAAIVLLVNIPAFSQLTEADQAAATLDFVRARELYRKTMNSAPDRKQRDQAALRLANLEWRLDRDATAAERDLAAISDESEQASAAWVERARIAGEVREDFAAAAAAAEHALGVARQPLDRSRAAYAHAKSIVEPIRRVRLAGRCDDDAGNLRRAQSELTSAVATTGPIPATARLLLVTALFSNDGPAALAAWRGYYGATAHSSILAPVAAILADKLPNWSADVSAAVRRSVGLAFADARMFPEARLVLLDPCAKHAVEQNDARVAEVLAYEAAIRTLEKQVDEYYRNLALGRAKPDVLRKITDDAATSLWKVLEWSGRPKDFSHTVLADYLGRAFGTYISVGNTSGKFDLHLAHRVLDEEREVTQYGHRGSLRFVELDGIVSNGFSSWVNDGKGGDGGWANVAIYQVRPLYVAGPYRSWMTLTDAETRARFEREIEDESRRDEERLASDPNVIPRGVAMRLSRQYLESVYRDVESKKLSAAAAREAFVTRVTQDKFASSIWAHEGRHAIDKKDFKIDDAATLEFRAKLSEVALAPSPRGAVDSIAFAAPPNAPHGIANRRIGALLAQWMRDHASSISGLDPQKAMLLQVDRLSDDQLRQAFRSMDPLAR